MRITLFGLLVVAGTLLLVVYAIEVYQERSQAKQDTKPGSSSFPDGPNSGGTIPG